MLMTAKKRFEIDFLILTAANSSVFELTNNMELPSGRNWILPKENTLACFKSGAPKIWSFVFCRKEIVQKIRTFGFSQKETCLKSGLSPKVTTHGIPGFNDVPKMSQV